MINWVMPSKLSVRVTTEDVKLAEQGNAGFCALAAGFMRKYDVLTRIQVRANLISMSDPTTRLRYDWVTPEYVHQWIYDWDHTDDKVRFLRDNPISVTLYVRDALVREIKTKTPQEKQRDRDYNARLSLERQQLTPEQKEERKRLRRNKIRGTDL